MAKATVVPLPKADVDLTEAPINVLHVDDEAGLLKAAKQILEMHGPFQVESALSVNEAMKKMKEKAFDTVVSDYVMPEKNGLDFLKELRERGNNIPFVLFTGKGREEVAINALNLGADYYANKIGDPRTVYGQLEHYINRAVEKRRAEIQLRKSEEKYRGLFENAPDVIALLDLKGNVTAINKAAVEYGFKEEEIIGKNILKFVSKKYWPRLLKDVAHILQRNSVKNKAEINTPKGKRIADYRSTPIIVDNRVVGIQVILIDITERKKTEEALVQERDKLESVAAAIGAGLVIVSKDYHVLWANDFIRRYKGDTIGKLCYATLNSLDAPCPDCGVTKIFAGKTTLDSHEYYSTTIDGKPYWVEIVATPITDENGNVISAVEIAVDITERKKAEEKLAESYRKNELVNEKLRVVGGLTRHDVRNKLSVIGNNVYLAKQRLADDQVGARYLEDVESAVKQVEKIFDFARAYEMLGVEELSYMNVKKSIDEAAMLFSGMNGVTLMNDCHGLTVLADSLLRQLIYNLIHNSLRHGEKVSQIRVYYEEVGEDQLKLVYEDDGIGIPEDEKELIFGEGYGKGTGYGLYLITKMCEAYGWTIKETGKHGKGAQFTMTLPKTNKNGKPSYQLK